MMRGYAIGMGAGTQALVHLPWLLIVGTPTELARALLMGAGWVINLAVAEWIIRSPLAYPIRLPAYAYEFTPGALESRGLKRSSAYRLEVQAAVGGHLTPAGIPLCHWYSFCGFPDGWTHTEASITLVVE